MTRLDEIRARCDAASKGPWKVEERSPDASCHQITGPGMGAQRRELIVGFHGDDVGVWEKEDADFIAHAREDVPWLLQWLELLKTLLRDAINEGDE